MWRTMEKRGCKHCGYQFFPRVENPKKCGNCQKPYPLLPQNPAEQTVTKEIHMSSGLTRIDRGNITSPKGFTAGSTFVGLKTYAEDKLDLGILMSVSPCSVAGFYTLNKLKSHSVTLDQERTMNGRAQALVVNSGIANACVGHQGYIDASDITKKVSEHLGLANDDVLICSTGLIGVELPVSLIKTGIDRIVQKEDGGHDLARAIITTDTRTKEIAFSFRHEEKIITVGGISKGSGMIHPNMATMLAFITTDAAISPDLLKTMANKSVDQSFNMITIDGDSSTNDTVLVFANGESGSPEILDGSPEQALLQESLDQVCVFLAKEIVRDGEGANKLIEVNVEGASSREEARSGAITVASSTLVKTAIHGNDPNWGRIVAALGRSKCEIIEEKIALYINDICIMESGIPTPFPRDSVVAIMSGEEVVIRLNLNLGSESATAWGCNLSEEYVTFNSAYTT
ncbi:uncharacterized protein METZ01_LOCUS84026 [marine metagenome]|uniref:Uncharacterized protein n=1 Tax=marine metagenome TaxID=408172 RepID=A0A381USL7_9ZZZZ